LYLCILFGQCNSFVVKLKVTKVHLEFEWSIIIEKHIVPVKCIPMYFCTWTKKNNSFRWYSCSSYQNWKANYSHDQVMQNFQVTAEYAFIKRNLVNTHLEVTTNLHIIIWFRYGSVVCKMTQRVRPVTTHLESSQSTNA
jgi:hypothetical protein